MVDRCVCCGCVIPEGVQICPTCELQKGMKKPSKIERKKALINFIEWKLIKDEVHPYKQEEILAHCHKMSFNELHKWAYINDFIDY